MNSFKYKIDYSQDCKTIKEILLSFHLGKEKISYFNNGLIFINSNQVNLEFIVHENDLLEVKLLEKIDLLPINQILDIRYEDQYYLVVNKPEGILVHSDGTDSITLNNLVANYYKEHHIRRKIRACNRLDYQTRGLIIYAKDPISEASMNYLINQRLIEKKYYALCYNRFSKKEGLISLPIGRDRHNSKKMIISKSGKEAETIYKVLKNGKVTLCDISLLTGRTHQIRLHLSYLNHPLVGDNLYGEDNENHLYLQSYYLKFNHPFTDEIILIKMDLDKMFISFMKGIN